MKTLRREWLSLENKQRRILCEETLQAYNIIEDDEKEILERFHTERDCGDIPEESIADVWLAISNLRSEEKVDKALLNLYYTYIEDIGFTENKEEEDEIFLSVLRSLTDNPWDSDDKYRIARLIWIKLRILITIDEETEKARAFVESVFNRGDFDTYIWDRIFGALYDWSGRWRLYPQILSWKNSFKELPDRFFPFIEDIKHMYSEAFRMTESLKSTMEISLYSVAGGTIELGDFRDMLRLMVEDSGEFPLHLSVIERIYRDGREIIRAILWDMVFIYLDKNRNHLVRDARDYLEKQALKEKNPYFRFLSFYSYLFSGFSETDLKKSWKESIPLSGELFPAILHSSESGYEMCMIFEQIWLSIINSGINIREINPIFGELLESDSLYIQKAAASAILDLSRKGISMEPVLENTLSFIKENPDMSTELSSGEDISEEERSRPQRTPTLTYYFPVDKKEGHEDDSFNMSTLTALLENLQQPHTTYRLSLALRHFTENFPEAEVPEEIISALNDYEESMSK